MTKEESSGEAAAQENSGGEAAAKDANADIFENRGSKKIIRLVTVLAYMFSVSFVAIVLSAYYLFLWKPPNPRLIRRNHLEADPQIEFLLSDAPILPNQSDEDLDEISTNSLFKEIVTDHMNLNSSHPMIVGRIGGDTFDVNDSIDTHEYDLLRSRKKFFKPLLILRNNLMDVLRGRILHSSSSVKSSDEKFPWKMESESMKNETLENDALTRNQPYFQTNKSSANDNNTSLKSKSSTIFRDQANKGLFTSEANSTKPGFVEKIIRVKDNSTRNIDVQKANLFDYLKNVEVNNSKNSRNTSNAHGNIGRNYTDVLARLQNTGTNSSNNEPINSNIKAVKMKKLSVYHSRLATGVTIIKSDHAESIEKDLPSEIDISAIKKNVNSSRITKFGDRLMSPQRSNVSSATTLPKIAINSGETQIERMTTKLTTARNELSQLDLETTAIKQPRDILTILTASTTASTKIPLTTSSSTISEDPQADFSSTTQTYSANTT